MSPSELAAVAAEMDFSATPNSEVSEGGRRWDEGREGGHSLSDDSRGVGWVCHSLSHSDDERERRTRAAEAISQPDRQTPSVLFPSPTSYSASASFVSCAE